jgi:hypothetical protein
MTKDDLRAVGETLRDGGRVRVSHGCGEGKTMLVSREGPRVRGWCFRCAEGLGVELALSISENVLRVQQAQFQAADAQFDGDQELPPADPDMSRWPLVSRLWLLKAGLAEDACRWLEVGWSQDMQRTVLPLRDRYGFVVSWTARAHDGRTPKYLTGHLPEGFVAEFPGGAGSGRPVVTEDWLSACKLGWHGIHTISMLGTYAKPATLLRLLEFKEPFVWLDNDLPPKHRVNWGQHHAAKLCKALRALGSRPINVVSDQEPKQLDRGAIIVTLARSAANRTPSVSAPDGESANG